MIYYVTFKVDGRYTATVEADNIDDAINLGRDEFAICDLNDMEVIEGSPVIVEDYGGNYLYEA